MTLTVPSRDRSLVVPARVRTFVAPAGDTDGMGSLTEIETRVVLEGEVESFTVDWNGGHPGPALDTGETISTSSFTAATGLTVDSSSNDGTTATVTLSGGTAGEAYKVTNEITTSAGRTLVFPFQVWVRAA